MRIIFAKIFTLALIVVVAGTAQLPVQAAGDCTVAPSLLPPDVEEQRLLAEINRYRSAPDYIWSDTLSRAAVWMATDNGSQRKKNNHTDSLGRDVRTRTTDCGYPSTLVVGENTTGGSTYAAGDFRVISEWQFSSADWQNVVSPQFTHAGIARVYNPFSPYVWHWVLVVGVDAGAPQPTATPVAPTHTPSPTALPPTATRTPTPSPTSTPVPGTVLTGCEVTEGDWPGPFTLECD